MSSQRPPGRTLLELTALVLTAALGYALWRCGWPELVRQLRGTWAFDLRHLAALVAVVAALWLTEKTTAPLWRRITGDDRSGDTGA